MADYRYQQGLSTARQGAAQRRAVGPVLADHRQGQGQGQGKGVVQMAKGQPTARRSSRLAPALALENVERALERVRQLTRLIPSLAGRIAADLPAADYAKAMGWKKTLKDEYKKIEALRKKAYKIKAKVLATADRDRALSREVSTPLGIRQLVINQAQTFYNMLKNFSSGRRANKHDSSKYTYYHGTAGSPIPIHWYKSYAKYHDITIVKNAFNQSHVVHKWNHPGDLTQPETRVLKINGSPVNQGIEDRAGTVHHLGVAVHNRLGGGGPNVVRRFKNVTTRDNQKKLNQALADNGYNLSTRTLDGDHVRDLGFEGTDTDNNFWPLERTMNQWGFTAFPHTAVNFLLPDGSEHASAIAGLYGKYFTLLPFQKPPVPHTDASGGS